MPSLCLLCCLFVTVALTAVTLTALFRNATVDGSTAAASNDTHKTEEKRNHQFGFHYFFGNPSAPDRSKPGFITTIDTIRLTNPTYAMKQFYCIVNEGPCDSVGLRLKASIPEEINADCKRCTRMETYNIRRILSYVKTNYPELWRRIEPLYKNKDYKA